MTAIWYRLMMFFAGADRRGLARRVVTHAATMADHGAERAVDRAECPECAECAEFAEFAECAECASLQATRPRIGALSHAAAVKARMSRPSILSPADSEAGWTLSYSASACRMAPMLRYRPFKSRRREPGARVVDLLRTRP
jgi:hypothetical protein